MTGNPAAAPTPGANQSGAGEGQQQTPGAGQAAGAGQHQQAGSGQGGGFHPQSSRFQPAVS